MPKTRRAKKAVVGEATIEHEKLNWDQGPVYYTNAIEVNTSVWDVKMRLTEILQVRDKKRLVMRELARVFMSPQHARVLLSVLARNLEQYEKRFGKIPGPLAD